MQVANRSSVEYVQGQRSAVVEVDFGANVGVYANSLSDWRIGQEVSPMSSTEKLTVLARIVDGLRAMGSSVEIC